MDAFVDVVKYVPGPIQVTRSVKVRVPGKHFPNLQPAEQAAFYDGTAVEFTERHTFPRHLKAWGAPHTGAGMRFICDSDAIDDPDHRGFWTTLKLWNKWRQETFKDNPEAELQYVDELPAQEAKRGSAAAGVKAEKAPPEVKSHFTIVSTGIHTFGGTGKLAGTTAPCASFACKKDGCSRGSSKPIKQVGSATGQLFTHLELCQPDLCRRLRANSKHSPVEIDENGEEYVMYSFDEALPHHLLFVEKCFRGLDHFNDVREDNGLKEWLRSFDKRAGLPAVETCQQILEVYEELYDETILAVIKRHKHAYGVPCAGSTTDIWSLSSCRESFGCLRASLVLDGDMVAQITGDDSCKGKLVDMSPILAFTRLVESRHTGAFLALWKGSELSKWELKEAIGLATEDGASPNKKANKILKQDMKVCVPHDVARAVLLASGEDGKPCKNPELKALNARSSKQSSSFSRSVVACKALQQAQLDADADLKEHLTLTPKVKNKTRWLGLWSMYNRNRMIGPEIRIALTGDESDCTVGGDDGTRSEESESGEESDGEEQEVANRAANKSFPLAHRCLSMGDFQDGNIFESLLDRPRETTLLVQAETEGFGEGLDIGLAWLAIKAMRDEAVHDRVEVVCGRKETETWKEVSGNSLKPMFKTFRKEFASQLTARFALDTTPDSHTLLALKTNPSINTTASSPLLAGKAAMAELMMANYKRALRRQSVLRKTSNQSTPVHTPSGTPTLEAPADSPTLEAPASAHAPTPARKRRKSLLGTVASQQSNGATPNEETSVIDAEVLAEMERFTIISAQIVAAGESHFYYEGAKRLNLRRFWAEHKTTLPLHFAVYITEVGCKKAAAANVETVFSGAGKFTEEARNAGHVLLSRIIRLHYNFKYAFLRPTKEKVIKRYNAKFRPNVFQKLQVATTAVGASSSAGAATPTA